MAGVNNVTGLYSNNNRKISSKLSFDVGESFTGRIVKSDSDSKDVVIKLMDGWQFPAELEKPLDLIPNGLLRFEVEGFNEGKLQIKLINIKDEDKESESSSLEDIIRDQNLSTKDSGLLERMIKFGIPLTKENVSRIKTLIGFSNKMKENEAEDEAFIQKYLKSKNIEPGSEKAQEIRNILKGFFSKLKGMSEEEILTLLENNIDLSEENIDSFGKVFNESSGIYKALLKGMGKEPLQTKTLQSEEFIQEFMKSKNIESDSENGKEIKNLIKDVFSKLKDLSKDEVQTMLKHDTDIIEAFLQKNIKSNNVEPGSEKAEAIKSTLKDLFSKLKDLPEEEIQAVLENNADLTEEHIGGSNKVVKENSSASKAFVKEMPKGTLQTESSQTEEFIQEFMKSINIEVDSEKGKEIKGTLKNLLLELKNLPEEEVKILLENNADLTGENIVGFNKVIKENSNDSKALVKEALKGALQTEKFIQEFMKSENIKPGTENEKEIRSIIKDVFSKLKNLSKDEIQTVVKYDADLTEIFLQKNIKSSNIKPGSEKAEEIKNTLNDFFSKLKSLPEEEIKTLLENSVDLTEENIDDFNKAFKEDNNVSKALAKETPKESVKTEEFIQGFMKNENIEPSSEKAKEIKSTLNDFFSKLKIVPKEEIKTLLGKGVNLTEENIDISDKFFKENSSISKELVKGIGKEALQTENNSTVQLIKQQIELKTDQMKTAIEKLLNTKDNGSPEIFSKVLDNLKEHLNDFKVFNSMSNQYYYMDVPLNIRETNYDFKLIVKDDRKSGKKLDSKNIKLAASVDTVNLGIVDAYFKVMNGKMDIDIKCEEPYVKLINSGKTILENELSNIGYNVNIVVDKKDKEMNIVNCRDFFGENNLNGINVVV